MICLCDGYDGMKIVERQMLQDHMPFFTAHIHCEMNVFPHYLWDLYIVQETPD